MNKLVALLGFLAVALWTTAQLTTFPVTGGGSGATTVAGLSDAGSAAYSNANAFALAQSGTIVTQNNSFSLLLSNALKLNAASSLSLSNATASRIAIFGADKTVGSATASGAVPIDADGSATTSVQINALFPGLLLTNGLTQAVTVSNTFTVDATKTAVLGGITVGGASIIRNGQINISGSGSSGGGWDINSDMWPDGDNLQDLGLGSPARKVRTIYVGTSIAFSTNYVAANFTPAAGYAKIVCSNGVLWRVTQQSTNLIDVNAP